MLSTSNRDNHLFDYIQNRRGAFKLSGIAKEMGSNAQSINNVMKGHADAKVTARFSFRLGCGLVRYGLRIKDVIFYEIDKMYIVGISVKTRKKVVMDEVDFFYFIQK